MPPKHPLWFRLLRLRCPGAGKRQQKNRKREGNDKRYIFGQNTCSQFRVGMRSMADVGCEVAAVYNALCHCGRGMSCADIIYIFEKKGYLMGGGWLGTDPYAVEQFFRRRGLPYIPYRSFDSLCAAVDGSRGSDGVFIVSFWNRRCIWGGLHTVAFYTCETDRLLHVFNLFWNDLGVLTARGFSELTDGKRFITGYRLNLPRVGCALRREMLS